MYILILPILLRENSFWNSDYGYDLIGSFLSDLSQISDIRHPVVATNDKFVGRMARQKKMDVLAIGGGVRCDYPLTVEQMLSLAENTGQVYGDCGDGCIIVDHRNTSLIPAQVEQAKAASIKNPESLVISVSQNRDHPCQWRAFSRFLGVGSVRYDSLFKEKETTISTAEGGRVDVALREGRLHCHISPDRSRGIETIVVRVIPFKNRADFTRSREFVFTSKDYLHIVEVDLEKDCGLLFIMTAPSSDGVYDAMEYFVPKGSPWNLMACSAKIRVTHTQKAIFGRQDFPSVYGFDGSFCVTGRVFQKPGIQHKIIPIILEDSYIVCDWVDYWYSRPFFSQFSGEEPGV